MTVRENSILVAAEFPVTALQLEHRPGSILQQIYFLYKRLDWKWTTWKGATDIFRNTYAKYSTELFQIAASSYSKFIKLEEKIVNINARKLYGASMRYVWQRKSDFLPYSHAPWMCHYIQFHWQFLITYSGPDWLIFCCGNSILHQKKFVEKQKNAKEWYVDIR